MANNYKVKIVDLQNKYKFKIFTSGGKYDDTEIKEEIDKIANLFPRVSGEGTNVSIDDTANYYMNLDLKGNGGKNLLSVPLTQNAVNALRSEIQNFQPGTYTFSFNMENTTGNQVTARKIVNGTTTQFTPKYNSTYVTFTLDEVATLQLEIYKSGILLSEVSNVQLEEGSTATDYEPYGASVTGNNTLTICGKNLLNISNQNTTISGATFKANNGKFLVNGTATSQIDGTPFRNGKYFPAILQAGTYNFSRSEVNSNVSLGIIDEDGNSLVTLTRTSQTMSGNFTISSKKNVYLYCFIPSGSVINNYEVELQVEKGSTKTTYEPYTGKSYPINLGSTKLKTDDSIQGTIDNWEIKKADGTIIAITDATLITQLNNLKNNAESYAGQTNISQVNDDLPFIITAGAIYDLSNLIPASNTLNTLSLNRLGTTNINPVNLDNTEELDVEPINLKNIEETLDEE